MTGLVVACLLLVSCAGSESPGDILETHLAPPLVPQRMMPPLAPLPELAAPVHLAGMQSGTARGVLGEPTLVRDEGGVQYWRYSYAGCTLDLFVNTGNDLEAAEVVYFELDRGDDAGASPYGCDQLAVLLLGQSGGSELPPVESF